MNLSLPTDRDERKKTPLFSGLFGYFAAALVGVARHSYRNNELHNKGQPMHWSVDKSNDHAECVQRHLLDLQEMIAAYERNPDASSEDQILEEADALAWRALALSQTLRMLLVDAPLPVNAKRECNHEPGVDCPVHPMTEENQIPVDLGPEFEGFAQRAGYPSPRCANCQQQTCICEQWPYTELGVSKGTRVPRPVPAYITRCNDTSCELCYRDATSYDDLPIG